MAKTFDSTFREDFENLIELKRSLGFKYEAREASFRRMDAFFVNKNLKSREVSRELCEEWCRRRSYESPANHSNRVSAMRVFCRYLNDIGLAAYVPPRQLVKKPPKYDAHIYTDDELHRFFAAVDASQSVPSECPFRGQVMPVFFRILYTSGMRVSELRLAKLNDINLEDGYIFIHGAKNRKDRIVPIHPVLVEKCRDLKESIHKESSEEEYFFMMYPGRAMPLVNVYRNFRRYLEKAGIPHTGRGPRVHDFRHTYCVNLLLKWSREGRDLMAYLPYMRTMLGHESFEETAYYLKFTTAAFPIVREKLEAAFPSIIEEVTFEEREYY